IVETALQAMGEADIILHMLPPKPELSEEDRQIAGRARQFEAHYFVLINKVDMVAKERLLPLMQKIHEELSPEEIIPVCAASGDGLDRVVQAIAARLQEGPAYYPTDQYTEHDLRFLSAESVREKAMQLLHEEIPYALTAQTEAFDESGKVPRIHVAIIVEKPSQKGIVIGAGGAMLKKIGELARRDIEAMVGKKVYLELFVKVIENWTKHEKQLKDLGIIP
ncbi:MAG TPA: GTPase Era, partial [Deltaproteobacteria bacterium]|nr:GTPase Era [Deltaproteobacteria bacterium]